MIHESVTITVLPPSAVCAGEREGEREGGEEREGERGRRREGGGERGGRDSHRAPERGTNVPETNLSMSLNSRFTESATCLQGYQPVTKQNRWF